MHKSGVKDLLGKQIVQFVIDVDQAHLLSSDVFHVADFTAVHPFHSENALDNFELNYVRSFKFHRIPFLCGTNGFLEHVHSARFLDPLHNARRFGLPAQNLVLAPDSYADHS